MKVTSFCYEVYYLCTCAGLSKVLNKGPKQTKSLQKIITLIQIYKGKINKCSGVKLPKVADFLFDAAGVWDQFCNIFNSPNNQYLKCVSHLYSSCHSSSLFMGEPLVQCQQGQAQLFQVFIVTLHSGLAFPFLSLIA